MVDRRTITVRTSDFEIRPPSAILRQRAPDPEYSQRPEERFNFSGFTGALER